MNNQTRLRGILALLLVTTAVLFAIGTTIERSQRHTHAEAAPVENTAGTTEGSASKTETGGETNGEKQGTAVAAVGTAETHVESTEKLFGIDTESVPATVAAVVLSLLLAAAVWWRRERGWLWAALVFGTVFAVGDLREVIHQLNESRTGVAIIASILIVTHLLVALISGLLLRQPDTRAVPSVAIGPSK